LSYLRSAGAKADATLPLTWGLLAISIAVVAVVCVLVIVAIARSRARTRADDVAPAVDDNASWWVYFGVAVSSFLLVATLVWTVRVLARVNAPSGPAALTIEVTGQQWWWKARYLDDNASRILTTANEIHIPVGKPVRIELLGADVIHSFWVPALGGKTDTIPGQVNTAWLEASAPGRYRGQCTEYCGEQHAHMGFDVVADPPDAFAAWLDAQLAPAPEPASDALKRGAHDFEFHCGACHTVRGTMAGGTTGPDLTHLMSRQSIAAGTLPNNEGMLAAWIANPQALKPGTHMPMLQLAGPEIGDISAWLATLH
ncbi:MAG TPA: cytochrome c oxidase subunit II, partial [Rhodanobacteraceae bacterium]|nr:cytochrome c oxidase subunit II [Rhodanobacteraceae bacterium]